MNAEIRTYHPSDLPDLYRICLLTGADGKDASALFQEPLLLGHFYAAPYAVKEPELCLIATLDGVPSGYILGTRDSQDFAQWTEKEWFPALRKRHPIPSPEATNHDAKMIRNLHSGYQQHPDTVAYPGHLHIDLLPSLQGKGMGKRLMDAFLQRLFASGCPAVHLGVSEANQGGIGFYHKLGFHEIGRFPGWRAMGMYAPISPT